MSYPIDGIARPTMEVPSMKCLICGREGVQWIGGKVFGLNPEKCHFLCLQCTAMFEGDYPKSAKREDFKRYEQPWNLWRNC